MRSTKEVLKFLIVANASAYSTLLEPKALQLFCCSGEGKDSLKLAKLLAISDGGQIASKKRD